MTRPARDPARTTALALAACLLALSTPAAAAAPDWNAVNAEDTVVVVTTDEDGAPRDTKIWLVLVDGAAYIRTGDSKWGENLVRKPELTLRAPGGEYPMGVAFVEDRVLRSSIETAFREKYGTSDWFIGFFRGQEPKIMRLEPR